MIRSATPVPPEAVADHYDELGLTNGEVRRFLRDCAARTGIFVRVPVQLCALAR